MSVIEYTLGFTLGFLLEQKVQRARRNVLAFWDVEINRQAMGLYFIICPMLALFTWLCYLYVTV